VIRLARSDRQFPELLRAIFDPPRELYLRGAGAAELLGSRSVAVVGARSSSAYGAQVARMLGRDLASAGIVVVSGLARGIDGEAHRGALEASGLTVGVLGCGIDRDYPASNASLSRRIEENGLVVSEYEPGVEPAPWRFPARERRALVGKPISLNRMVRTRRAALVIAWRCGPGVVPGLLPGPGTVARNGGSHASCMDRRV
jgi:DNA processing protein